MYTRGTPLHVRTCISQGYTRTYMYMYMYILVDLQHAYIYIYFTYIICYQYVCMYTYIHTHKHTHTYYKVHWQAIAHVITAWALQRKYPCTHAHTRTYTHTYTYIFTHIFCKLNRQAIVEVVRLEAWALPKKYPFTLTYARIHIHTYINVVQITWLSYSRRHHSLSVTKTHTSRAPVTKKWGFFWQNMWLFRQYVRQFAQENACYEGKLCSTTFSSSFCVHMRLFLTGNWTLSTKYRALLTGERALLVVFCRGELCWAKLVLRRPLWLHSGLFFLGQT